MKRLFTLLMLSVLSLGAFAQENKGLKTYLCDTEVDALLCAGSCQSETSAMLDFNVDVSASTVTKYLYQGGKLLEMTTFGNCAVADEKNWLCRSSSGSGAYKMVNGTYFAKSVLGSSTLYWCAK